MMRRIRFLLLIAVAAAVGAVAGRVAAEVRRQREAGERIDLSLADVKIRLQDLVPGLVAAARVRDTPWSLLHIPSWLAAFAMNLGVGAVGGDLSRIREMAERAAFGLAGIEIADDDDDPDGLAAYGSVLDDDDLPPPRPASHASTNGGGSVTWTAPGPAERRDDAPAGFTAFRD